MTKWIGLIVLCGWILIVLDIIANAMHWFGLGPKPPEISTSMLLVCLLLILEKVNEKQGKEK